MYFPGHCENNQCQQDGQGWMQGENLDCGLVRAAQQQDGRRPEENPDRRALHDRDLESGWDGPRWCGVPLVFGRDQQACGRVLATCDGHCSEKQRQKNNEVRTRSGCALH